MNNFKRIIFISLAILLMSFSSKAEQAFFSFNYGQASHDMGTILRADGKAESTLKKDDEAEGYMASAGYLIFSNFGVEAMYYDLGSTSFKVTAKDVIKDDNNSYIVATTGTITNDISGYGLGLVGAGNAEFTSYLNMTFYAKVGAHAWEKSGSTTLLDNNDAFASGFYNDGIGAYGALGTSLNFTDNIGVNLTYHTMGMSNDVSFGNSSSVASAGIRLQF